jgi:hypothetical protein
MKSPAGLRRHLAATLAAVVCFYSWSAPCAAQNSTDASSTPSAPSADAKTPSVSTAPTPDPSATLPPFGPNTDNQEAPRLTTGPTFTCNLDVKNGFIVENGKPVAPATVANVLNYVQKQISTAKIAYAPDVANITVGDLSLRSTWIHAFSVALTTATGNQIVFRNSRQAWSYYTSTTYLPPQLRVYNLTPYFKSVGATDPKAVDAQLETLTAFIKKSVQGTNADGAAGHSLEFEFHEGSGVLAVIGQETDLETVDRIIAALQPKPAPEVEIQISLQNLERLLESVQESQATADPAMKKMLQGQLQEQIDELGKLIQSFPASLPANAVVPAQSKPPNPSK